MEIQMEVKSDCMETSTESSFSLMDSLEVECIEAIELMGLFNSNFANTGQNNKKRSEMCDVNQYQVEGKDLSMKRKSRSYEKENVVLKKPKTESFIEPKCQNQKGAKQESNSKPKPKQRLPDEPIKCQYCDYSTRRKNHLIVHERAHTNDKPYACQYCDYTTIQQSTLTRHERTHTNEKRYFCQFCDYKAARKDHLVVHERTHTHEKPYACSYCLYRAATKSDLTVHERTHTLEKPYACHTCPYTTTQQSTLTVHERIHTNEKPYLCKQCSYSAAQLSSLNNHIRTHHQ
jgi:uncharacterized Zn-finger protein